MGRGGSLQSWRRRRAGLPSCWVFTPEHTGSFQNIFISPLGTLAVVHHCCVEMCFGLCWSPDPLSSQPCGRSSTPGPLPAAESLTAGGEGRLLGVPLERARASRGTMPGLAPRFFPPGPPVSPGPTAASVASQVRGPRVPAAEGAPTGAIAPSHPRKTGCWFSPSVVPIFAAARWVGWRNC